LLECDDLKVVGSRLRRLAEASEKPEEYAMEVEPRFQSNLEFLRSMRKLTEVRDFVFLEVFLTQQWRGRYRSLEHFIEAEAGISRGTFYKAVDKAEIRIQLLEAGIEATPTVRQFEQLARVEKNHRVPAWKEALRIFSEAGSSEAVARYAFVRYCHDNGVQFGRMKFGREMTELDLLAAKQKSCPTKPESHGNDANWVDRIAPEVVQAIADCMPTSIRERVGTKGCGDECGIRFLHALQTVTNQEPRWNPEFERMYRVLQHLKSCEPAIAEGLMRLAIGSIYNFVESEVLLGMRLGPDEQRKAC
jgi:hypothetical protein